MADFAAYSQSNARILGYLAKPVAVRGEYATMLIRCERSVYKNGAYEKEAHDLPVVAKNNPRRGRGGSIEADKKWDGLPAWTVGTPVWVEVDIITDKEGKPFLKATKYGRAYVSPKKSEDTDDVVVPTDDEAPF